MSYLSKPKQFLALLLGLAFTPTVVAESISLEQAQEKAQTFFAQKAGKDCAQLALAYTATDGSETYYYVFNHAAGGYVIIAGDDVAHDVLGYNKTGVFDSTQLTPAMQWWLSQYTEQIQRAIAVGCKPASQRRAAQRAAEHQNIAPLLGDIAWDQDLPYNAMINGSAQIEDENNRYATGCVATAGAQIMRYWKYPKKGMLSRTYRHEGITYTADFAQTEYKWDLMQDTYEPTYSGTPEEDAVAELMAHLGVATLMDYNIHGENGSGTPISNLSYALRTYFGYSKDMKLIVRENESYSAEEWDDLVYAELAARRPVLYSGGPHAYVCDGYEDGLFHINWGWSGNSNDYFLLTATDELPALTPSDTGIGSNGNSSFDEYQEIFIGLQPDPTSEGYIYVEDGLMGVPEEISAGTPLHIDVKILNPTSNKIMALPNLALIETANYSDGATTFIGEVERVYVPAKGEVEMSFDIEAEQLEPGATYQIRLSNAIKNEGALAITSVHVEGPTRVWITMPTNGVRTLCLPFDYEVAQTPGLEAYAALEISNDDELVLQRVSHLEAGVGYIIKGDQQFYLFTGETVTDEAVLGKSLLVGNLQKGKTLPQGWLINFYGFPEEPGFQRFDMPIHAPWPQYTAFIAPDATEADFIAINLDHVTAIEQVRHYHEPTLMYNLLGQPVRVGQGLCIKNGRMVVVPSL